MKFALSEQTLLFVIASIIASQYDFPSTARGNATFFNIIWHKLLLSFGTMDRRRFGDTEWGKLIPFGARQHHALLIVGLVVAISSKQHKGREPSIGKGMIKIPRI